MPANVQVMLVEDNPMILGMLRQALAPLANIITAEDGADAMLKAIETPPDIIISDFAMTGMDGKQLLTKLKGRPGTQRIAFILLAAKNDIAEKLKPVQDMVEDLIEKPFFLKETVSRIKRVVDKISLEKMAREAPGEGVLRGSLSQMNVIDLLQSLELGKKGCVLTLTNGNDRCEMFFNDGQINHAVYGAVKGDDAVYKVLTWTGGNFQIDFNGKSSEQTITRSTQGLLMEGLRLIDEANRDTEENVLEA
jgi:CheY-like chemotaxis protein